MHCQKSGLDIETSAAVRHQLRLRQDVFNIALVVILYLYFKFCVSLGAGPAMNSLLFGKAKTLALFFFEKGVNVLPT